MGGRTLDRRAGEGRAYHSERYQWTGVGSAASTTKVNSSSERSRSLSYEAEGRSDGSIPVLFGQSAFSRKNGNGQQIEHHLNERERLRKGKSMTGAKRLDGPLRQKGSLHGWRCVIRRNERARNNQRNIVCGTSLFFVTSSHMVSRTVSARITQRECSLCGAGQSSITRRGAAKER